MSLKTRVLAIIILLILIIQLIPNSCDSKRRAIAVVSPYDLSVPGGVQCQVCELAREYKKYAPVFVFAPGKKPNDLDPELHFEAVGKTSFVKNNGSTAPVGLNPLEALKLRSKLLQFEFVHIHEPYAPLVSWMFLMSEFNRNQHVVLTFHRSSDQGSRMEALGYNVAKLCTKGCVLVGVSRQAIRTSACNDLIEIPNGIRLPDKEYRRKFPRIVFVGRHEPRKGLEVLLKAYTESDELRKKFSLSIIGQGELTDALQKKYSSNNSRIEWLGRVSSAVRERYVAESAVYCAPTLGGESFGIVLLEAMILRTPVVASNINGYREAANGHALLVPPGDSRELEKALLEFDRVDVDKAFSYASQFDVSRIADQYAFLLNI